MNDARFDSHQPAVALDAGLQINDGPRAPAVRVKNLFARVGNLYRTRGAPGEHGRGEFQRDDLAFPAESAADQRLDDAHALLRHLERRGECFLQIIRHLRGGPDGE